jgi:Fe-S-cluster-containing hydrogenase component 2
MRIKVDPKKCSGCHLCEMVCSLTHLGLIHPERSAIRVQKDDLDTSLNTPLLCRQCKTMKCLDGEEDVSARERKKFVWSPQRVRNCPFNGLTIFDGHAYHCDLCLGNPQCVKVCTPGALTLSK